VRTGSKETAINWALALGLGLIGLVFPDLAASQSVPGGPEVAYFQPRNIYHSGLPEGHTVALTFDDGPNAHTPAILDALRTMNVKATFFIVGTMAKAHPDILARIAAEGHLLANHSASHPFLTKRYDRHPELLIDQIREVNDEIAPLMKPGDQLFFRAPYGAWRSAHAQILNADPVLRNYTGPIYWDEGGNVSITDDGYVMSAADWACWHQHWAAEICAKGYLREIRRKNGGVVLMHCIHEYSATLVEAVVPALIEEGYRFVRVDQVAAYKPFETPETAPAVAQANAPLRTASLLSGRALK
jgi:peptidoglycan/xylan/chitin deacetylase (PgdA/CDA1 family)